MAFVLLVEVRQRHFVQIDCLQIFLGFEVVVGLLPELFRGLLDGGVEFVQREHVFVRHQDDWELSAVMLLGSNEDGDERVNQFDVSFAEYA